MLLTQRQRSLEEKLSERSREDLAPGKRGCTPARASDAREMREREAKVRLPSLSSCDSFCLSLFPSDGDKGCANDDGRTALTGEREREGERGSRDQRV